MDPAERWRRHWPALILAMAVGLVIINVTVYMSAAVRYGAIAAYGLVLLVAQKLGAFGS